VLALALRWPKYNVSATPRSRVRSTVSTSPMRTLTASPLSSVIADFGLAGAAAGGQPQHLRGELEQSLRVLRAFRCGQFGAHGPILCAKAATG
jgi:hypothetical protein